MIEFIILAIIFWVVYSVFFKHKKASPRSIPNKHNDGTSGHKNWAKSPRIESDSHNNEKLMDDDLASFTISYGYEEAKSKNKTPGRWVKPGEIIEIKGLTITSGNFYYGGKLKDLGGYSTESSLVDNSLKIKKESIEYEDDTLGYWPKFISLSPKARGAYLNWLASPRDNALTPLGYVFIYFYGLERRILVDAKKKGSPVDNNEFSLLFNEITRLKSVYGHSRSFHNYSTNLLELMCLLRAGTVPAPDKSYTYGNYSLLFRHQLATTVDAGVEVSAELALAWLKYYPEYSLKTPAKRCDKEFSSLFMLKYTQKYVDGFIVKPNKTRLNLEYQPASSSLRSVRIGNRNLPDPSILKAPVKRLIAIADICTEELNAYSRYLGRKETSRVDISAILLLPDELTQVGDTTIIGKFKKWADTKISECDGLVSVSDLWSQTGTLLPSKINKKEMELILNLTKKAGYGIAPDPRFHHAKMSLDGKLVIFVEGHGEFFEPSNAFNEVGMALRLGAMVANIDEHLHDLELMVLHQLIDHNSNLSPIEKRSLHAYLIWRLNTPANMAGLKSRIENLGIKEKHAVSYTLISIALADGKITPSEIKQLEKMYVTLGLDKSLVTNDIHEVTSTRKAIDIKSSSMILKETGQSFQLDDDLLAHHESETKDVQSMLGSIFVDANDLEENQDIADLSSHVDESLDALHSSLFESLTSKEKWTRKEVEELCHTLGLLIDGAIETINNWSFDTVDAPVLDEDDDIYVDQEIIIELATLRGSV